MADGGEEGEEGAESGGERDSGAGGSGSVCRPTEVSLKLPAWHCALLSVRSCISTWRKRDDIQRQADRQSDRVNDDVGVGVFAIILKLPSNSEALFFACSVPMPARVHYLPAFTPPPTVFFLLAVCGVCAARSVLSCFFIALFSSPRLDALSICVTPT